MQSTCTAWRSTGRTRVAEIRLRAGPKEQLRVGPVVQHNFELVKIAGNQHGAVRKPSILERAEGEGRGEREELRDRGRGATAKQPSGCFPFVYLSVAWPAKNTLLSNIDGKECGGARRRGIGEEGREGGVKEQDPSPPVPIIRCAIPVIHSADKSHAVKLPKTTRAQQLRHVFEGAPTVHGPSP